MPYISQEDRKFLAQGVDPVTAGGLNYSISRLCDNFIMSKGLNYNTLNEVIGVLACVQQELYRRVVAPYEDQKMRSNGDVFNAAGEPIAIKSAGPYQLSKPVSLDHQGYHIDFEIDEGGAKVPVMGPNRQCPYCFRKGD